MARGSTRRAKPLAMKKPRRMSVQCRCRPTSPSESVLIYDAAQPGGRAAARRMLDAALALHRRQAGCSGKVLWGDLPDGTG